MAATQLPRTLHLWRLVRVLDLPALFVGGIAAAAGNRWGGYVLVANLLLQFGSHLGVGGWAYHDVMSRPWPEVPQLPGDEWDE